MYSSELKQVNRNTYNAIEGRLYDKLLSNSIIDRIWKGFVRGEAEVEKKKDYVFKINYMDYETEITISDGGK